MRISRTWPVNWIFDMPDNRYHVPVMLDEVEQYLITRRGGMYVDCTVGGGGYEAVLLEKYPKIRFIGIDRDEDALSYAGEISRLFGERFKVMKGNFGEVENVLEKQGVLPA